MSKVCSTPIECPFAVGVAVVVYDDDGGVIDGAVVVVFGTIGVLE